MTYTHMVARYLLSTLAHLCHARPVGCRTVDGQWKTVNSPLTLKIAVGRTVGHCRTLSDCRTVGLSDCRIVGGLSGTVGPYCRTVGPGLRLREGGVSNLWTIASFIR